MFSLPVSPMHVQVALNATQSFWNTIGRYHRKHHLINNIKRYAVCLRWIESACSRMKIHCFTHYRYLRDSCATGHVSQDEKSFSYRHRYYFRTFDWNICQDSQSLERDWLQTSFLSGISVVVVDPGERQHGEVLLFSMQRVLYWTFLPSSSAEHFRYVIFIFLPSIESFQVR